MATSLTRWNPFEELSNWWPRSMFNRELVSAMRPDGTMSIEWNPRCDMTENDKEVMLHVELPGVEEKDIDISVAENVLTIRGEKKQEQEEQRDGQTYTERFFGSFERRMSLPANIDIDNASAQLKGGVLELRLPKLKPEEPEAKKINIRASS